MLPYSIAGGNSSPSRKCLPPRHASSYIVPMSRRGEKARQPPSNEKSESCLNNSNRDNKKAPAPPTARAAELEQYPCAPAGYQTGGWVGMRRGTSMCSGASTPRKRPMKMMAGPAESDYVVARRAVMGSARAMRVRTGWKRGARRLAYAAAAVCIARTRRGCYSEKPLKLNFTTRLTAQTDQYTKLSISVS